MFTIFSRFSTGACQAPAVELGHPNPCANAALQPYDLSTAALKLAFILRFLASRTIDVEPATSEPFFWEET